MTKIVTIDNASFDALELTALLQRAIRMQTDQEALKEDFKKLVKEAELKTKLKAKKLRAFFKARFNATTQEIVKAAEDIEALSNAVDG